MTKPMYEIDGANFSTLEEFWTEIERALIPGAVWGRNLDAFDDILRGGFGTPAGGFELHWRNAQRSRERLGYPETVRQLESRLHSCHPTNRAQVQLELTAAQRGIGPTVFDWLVGIIREHCAGSDEGRDGIELVLD